MENRFLFIVETSSDMKSRADEITRAVVGLLNSDLKGELRPGDTIGLWTYSATLHPEFPMQVWSGEKKEDITELARQYLRQVRFEKLGHLDKVWPALRQAVAKSERLTVIFIYDSDETMRGTPFDRDINALQKKYRREFHSENLPVVTVLSARGGQFFDYTINYPGSISLPHTADPLPTPETNAPPAVAAAPPPPPPAPATPPVEPKPLRVIEIVRPPQAANAPAPATVSPTPAASLTAAPSSPLAAAPAAASEPQPAAVMASPSAANQAVSAPPTLPAPQPPPATIAPASAANANVAATPPPAPLPATRTEPVPAVPPLAPTPQPAPMPVTIASAGQQAALFVIAISLLIIAVALVIFLLRRSRGGQSSLISQVINRPR
jgi:hypothetical protein